MMPCKCAQGPRGQHCCLPWFQLLQLKASSIYIQHTVYPVLSYLHCHMISSSPSIKKSASSTRAPWVRGDPLAQCTHEKSPSLQLSKQLQDCLPHCYLTGVSVVPSSSSSASRVKSQSIIRRVPRAGIVLYGNVYQIHINNSVFLLPSIFDGGRLHQSLIGSRVTVDDMNLPRSAESGAFW
jgi:hypothetical protein